MKWDILRREETILFLFGFAQNVHDEIDAQLHLHVQPNYCFEPRDARIFVT